MSVKKLSVSLETHTYELARASARGQGISLSAWLDRAAVNFLRDADRLAAIAEIEADFGPFTDEEIAAADAILSSTEQVT